MRIFVTGASGFVGSNLAHVFAQRHDAEVVSPGREYVDVTDGPLVRRTVAATRPDAIVHAAIWNDPARLERDRGRAWEAYVGATRNLVDAANAVGAHVVLVSTDWVFDGTQAPAREIDPPRPVNTYGFLKASSELVVTERAERGAVARIAAVQGVHRGGASMPRSQDAGFGYLVSSLMAALGRGERFTVWDGPGLNTLATPTLASDAAELIWEVLVRGATGILHCCGGEHAHRVELARRAVQAFDLDPELLEVGAPPPDALPPEGVPVDTRMDASATAEQLGVDLPDLDTTLTRLRGELLETAGAPV
jgi:dTDP-4-dehydrorhamnose reductase